MSEKVNKALIPVALQPGTKLLKLAYSPQTDTQASHFIIWIHHDRTMQFGTYLELHANGEIWRVTQRPDGSEERGRVS